MSGPGNTAHPVNFLPVREAAGFARVAALAAEIWREHYTPIIGAAQVEYMLKRFQSEEAIAEQVEKGYRYYVTEGDRHAAVGYLAFVAREGEMFVSKLYVRRQERGKGYGRRIMDFIEARAEEKGLERLTLTVNKNNRGSIEAYKKMGFAITGPVVTEIGGGFVMDDLALSKDVRHPFPDPGGRNIGGR